MRVAFVFPGQGSQRVGMGREFLGHPIGRDTFARADAILGFSLSAICLEGPEDLLTRTEVAQPAIFTVSHLAARMLDERGVRPTAVAGHSLGEYSALVVAGVMSFDDGLLVVRRRGELMAAIGDQVEGAMAAIVNLTAEAVEEICHEVPGQVEVANYNSPKQTVISGNLSAIDEAIALAKARGARAVRLNVAAPFHSSFMAPLADEMARVLADVEMHPPRIPIVTNITAEYAQTPQAIREALTRQIAGSVRWADSIRRLADDGVEATIEVGPGGVLTGLTPRIVPSMQSMDTQQALAREW
jgi:[acyl-carrier-protein] S-malonyltransferase